MQYLHNFSSFGSEYNLNESFNFSSWKKEFEKVKKQLGVQFFFISTFGMGITVFFPVIQNLIDNSNIEMNLSKPDVVMLTICAISILANENKNSIDKIKEKLQEKNLLGLLGDVVKSIKSIKNILFKTFEKIGDVVFKDGGILDLLGYTALFVPSLEILLNLINEEGLSINKIIGLGLSYGLGVSTFFFKNFINRLLNKLQKSPKEVNEAILLLEKRTGSLLETDVEKIILKDSKGKIIKLNYVEWVILDKIITTRTTTFSKLTKHSRFKVKEIIDAVNKLIKDNIILKEKGSPVLEFNENMDPSLKEIILQKHEKFN